MKLLLFIFLITRTQQYFFQRSIQNDTYLRETRLQQLNKPAEKTSVKSMISNRVLILISACLFLVIIATLLTVYFTKDQLKDFITRISRQQRGPVIHQFNPQVFLPERNKQQTNSNEQTHGRLPGHTKSKPEDEGQKRERTSVHGFMNASNKHQQDSLSNHRQSQSADDLFLYR